MRLPVFSVALMTCPLGEYCVCKSSDFQSIGFGKLYPCLFGRPCQEQWADLDVTYIAI